MTYPHVMRLRGPWRCQAIARSTQSAEASASLPPARNIHLEESSTLIASHLPGRLRLARRFQSPARLDLNERLWIVVQQAPLGGSAFLNGTPLGPLAPDGSGGRFEITSRIDPSNDFWVEIECDRLPDELPAVLLDGVQLEVHQVSEAAS